LMQIHACSADAAAQLVQEAADDGMTTKEFYRRIQARISPRMLVDKSPAYALDATALRKAERDFQDPLYIHLVRHPNAVVESFVENHIDQVLYLDPHRFEARVLAEAVWTLSHRTIIDFLRDVPPQRQHQIRFEDLVADPGAAMRALCSGLGLPFDEQLLRPYDGLEAKMVDGVHPESAPMGDPSFVQHGKIRAEIADRWRDTHRDDLGESTWELAEDLGYRRTPGDQPPVGRQDDRRRRMLAQLRARRVGRRAEVASDGGGDAAGARERRSGDE
jgi:hypothetical protein